MIAARIIELLLFFLAASGVICVALATLYDLQMISQRKKLQHEMHRLSARRQPHVTVIITHVISTVELARSIESIYRSNYRSYDILAVADVSMHGKQRRGARQLLGGYPSARLYVPRQSYADEQLMRRSYGRSGRGEFVLRLEAGQEINQMIIRRSVSQLVQKPGVTGVHFAGYIDDITSLSTLVAAFIELSRQLAAKAMVAMSVYPADTRRAGLYRWKILTTPHVSCSMPMTYDSDSLITLDRQMPSRISVWGVAATSGLLAIVLYCLVLAATLQSTMPLLLSWSIVALWLLAGVWFSETSAIRRKLGLSLCIPIGYFVMAGVIIVHGGEMIIRRAPRR